jgi:hypothetical protein
LHDLFVFHFQSALLGRLGYYSVQGSLYLSSLFLVETYIICGACSDIDKLLRRHFGVKNGEFADDDEDIENV